MVANTDYTLCEAKRNMIMRHTASPGILIAGVDEEAKRQDEVEGSSGVKKKGVNVERLKKRRCKDSDARKRSGRGCAEEEGVCSVKES
ncbi:unnamed protein product [Cylicostephanus goldi]|uniref:Uncharacterized protein n=1 Tax=Cylicostephanus goldi TaxID=71465 RepID=A0A3P7N5T7_CYLGO|nr:unnamed protein product [Cylicostephanus goldi]